MFYILIIFLICSTFIINLYLILDIRTNISKLVELSKHIDENKVEVNESYLTSYELERLRREDEFDDRITRLKEELASQQNIIKRGTNAEELHPLVKNLPHNIIRDKEDHLPDVEFTD